MPSFGQPSQPTGAFGQAAQPTPAFGQPAGAGQFGATNPFAAPSPAGGFGNAGTFGQASQPTPTFSQPNQPTPSFGQPSNPTPAFGQPPTSQPSFGSGPFATSGAFGQPSTTFGQPLQPAGSFGEPPKPGSGFPQPAQPIIPPANPPKQATPFGASPAPSDVSTASTLVGHPSNSSDIHPLINRPAHPVHYTQTLPAGRTNFDQRTKQLLMYKGRRVEYINDAPCYERPDGQGWERIWFPEGANSVDVKSLTKEGKVQDLVPEGEGVYNEEVLGQYRFLAEHGRFETGKMPSVPPKREWCTFDF